MTIAISHTALRGEGLAPWYAIVRWGTRERRLSSIELLDLCAAIEFDRVWPADLERLWKLRQWRWTDLADGAHGCRPEESPGLMTIAECLRKVGIEIVDVHVVTDARLGEAIAKASQKTRHKTGGL